MYSFHQNKTIFSLLFNTILVGFIFVFVYISISFFVPAHEARAQVGFAEMQEGSLESDPDYPAPHSTTTITLEAYTRDTAGATIRWYVDGARIEEFKNKRSIPVTIGAVGEKTTVRAVVTGVEGPSFTASRTFRPIPVDLLIEAQTVVPSFYNGLPLPTRGSTVRIIAIPHTGSSFNTSDLSYKWSLSGETLYGGALKGRQAVTLAVPKIGNPTVSVIIYNPAGEVLTQKAVSLNLHRPELYFYKENPLRSTNRVALGDDFSLTKKEVTLRVAPYYVDTDVFGDRWDHTWTLDGKEVQNGNLGPQFITLRQTGGGGEARVGFSLTNTENFIQSAQSSFTVFFDGVVNTIGS